MKPSYQLAAVEFKGRIVVFGGVYERVMYELNQEGELVEDLSD